MSNVTVSLESRNVTGVVPEHMEDLALISHRVVIIRIPVLYRADMDATELYESTRGVWRMNVSRARASEYVFSVIDQVVREVYRPTRWAQAGSTPYAFRSQVAMRRPGRWEFVGEVAAQSIRARYVNLPLGHMFPHGAANPIMYLNM